MLLSPASSLSCFTCFIHARASIIHSNQVILRSLHQNYKMHISFLASVLLSISVASASAIKRGEKCPPPVTETCTVTDWVPTTIDKTCTVTDYETVKETCTVTDWVPTTIDVTCTVTDTSTVKETCTVTDYIPKSVPVPIPTTITETCTVTDTKIVTAPCSKSSNRPVSTKTW